MNPSSSSSLIDANLDALLFFFTCLCLCVFERVSFPFDNHTVMCSSKMVPRMVFGHVNQIRDKHNNINERIHTWAQQIMRRINYLWVPWTAAIRRRPTKTKVYSCSSKSSSKSSSVAVAKANATFIFISIIITFITNNYQPFILRITSSSSHILTHQTKTTSHLQLCNAVN